MRVRESDIESRVCDYAKRKYNFMARKFTSPNHRSVPDRLFLGDNGHHFFIEFKAPGGRNTSGQEREQKRLKERGHRVYVCDNVEHGKHIVDREVLWWGRYGTPPVDAPLLPEEGD